MTPPLKLKQIVWDRFTCLEPFQKSWMDELPYWEDYTAAFFRSNGIEYSAELSNVREWLQAEDRAPFVKMAEALLLRLSKMTSLNDVEFVLLAHWLPDLHLGSSVTNFAMHYLGLTSAFGFAISDRGLTAPFFAFDCIAKYLRDGRSKALLMVMDQKHLLYKSTLRDALMPDNSACLMLIERSDSPGLSYLGYRRCVRNTGITITSECLAMRDALSLRPEVTTIIASDELLSELDLPAPTVRTDPHLVCAAPFVALSENISYNRDYLVLTHDANCLTGVGFRTPEN